MSVIYQPKGRAREYSHLALNPWGKSWCSHDCDYCYVPGTCRMSREQWRQQGFKSVTDLLKKLRADCKELAGTNERVLLCFMGDLYSPEAAETCLPRQILTMLREHDIPFQVLTKGGTLACRDFDLYGKHDAFATTMTFLDPHMSELHEPGAQFPAQRILAIQRAYRKGIETWVSLEPVLDPAQSLEVIRRTHLHVDLFKVGKLNHDKQREAEIDWGRFGREAVTLCEKYGVPYYVKDDLAKHLEGFEHTNTDIRKVQR